jgi:signal recognition particle GTPase
VPTTGLEDSGSRFAFGHFLTNSRALLKMRPDPELEKDVRIIEALASAMTPEELRNPDSLSEESQRLRIARQAEVPMEEAARLINRFQFMRQFYRSS